MTGIKTRRRTNITQELTLRTKQDERKKKKMATCKPTVESLTTSLYQQQERSEQLHEIVVDQEREISYLRKQLLEAKRSDHVLTLESKVAQYSDRAQDAELLTLKLRAENAALQAKLTRAEIELRNLQSRVSFK